MTSAQLRCAHAPAILGAVNYTAARRSHCALLGTGKYTFFFIEIFQINQLHTSLHNEIEIFDPFLRLMKYDFQEQNVCNQMT